MYERSAIEEWLEQNEKSPHTNEPMGTKLLPATQVKNLIASMVRSGAISGDKAGAWTKKLEGEKEVEEMRRKAEAGDSEAMVKLAVGTKTARMGWRRAWSSATSGRSARPTSITRGIGRGLVCLFRRRDRTEQSAWQRAVRAGGHHGRGSRVLPDGG